MNTTERFPEESPAATEIESARKKMSELLFDYPDNVDAQSMKIFFDLNSDRAKVKLKEARAALAILEKDAPSQKLREKGKLLVARLEQGQSDSSRALRDSFVSSSEGQSEKGFNQFSTDNPQSDRAQIDAEKYS